MSASLTTSVNKNVLNTGTVTIIFVPSVGTNCMSAAIENNFWNRGGGFVPTLLLAAVFSDNRFRCKHQLISSCLLPLFSPTSPSEQQQSWLVLRPTSFGALGGCRFAQSGPCYYLQSQQAL